MADDWIKMRTDLYRDPKVCVIADILMQPGGELAAYINQNCQTAMAVTRNVMRNVTVGALVSIWGVMRVRGKRNGDDLMCDSVTPSVMDDIAELPGIGSAMVHVGWAEQVDDGIVFPRFFENYNSPVSEKAPSKSADRQRLYRERMKERLENGLVNSGSACDATHSVTSDVTSDVTLRSREEKRRVNPIAPLGFDSFWDAYPKKVAKADAVKAFAKLKADVVLLESIISAVRAACSSDGWLKDGGRFVPNAATWLNGRRWEDDLLGASSSVMGKTADELAEEMGVKGWL